MLQCVCLRQLLLATAPLEHVTVEVEVEEGNDIGNGVQVWAQIMVAAIKNVQQSHGRAQALRSLEVVSRHSVKLQNLWCARWHVAHPGDPSALPMSQALCPAPSQKQRLCPSACAARPPY